MEDARFLLIVPGPDTDTLLVVGDTPNQSDGLYKRYEGSEGWGEVLRRGSFHVLVTQQGTYLTGARSGALDLDRSTDGGRTWAEIGPYNECLYEQPSDGTLLACAQQPLEGLYRSTDDGQTWTSLGPVPADEPLVPIALIEHPSAGPGGAPRLVINAKGGLLFSNDGGENVWRSNISQNFRWYGIDLALAREDAPDAGTVYAAVMDFATGEGVLFASTDGAVWRERSRLGTAFLTALEMGSDGALYVGRVPTLGAAPLLRSADGGVTWQPVGEGYDGACVADLASGTDGRLYLAGCSGVWRTTEPLPVSNEAGPEAEERARLEVVPNPFRGRATVAFRLGAAEEVSVQVYDVLGRRVMMLAEDRYPAGLYEVRFDASTLPSGIYIVRLETGGTVQTQRVTLLR